MELDYDAINKERQERFLKIYNSPKLIEGSEQYYKTRPVEFINDWGVIYNPRNVGTGNPTTMPFILFDRQVEFINFLYDCTFNKENGACEKSRDMGATWAAAGFAVWLWKYHPESAVGFGSRKEMYVDRKGIIDSIFEKIRVFIRNLPSFCKPKGYIEKEHALYMRIINPENKATIIGEAGEEIGRGGRTTLYFVDESAALENPESVEASLGDNTDVRIDISSVRGPNTVFQRKVESGVHWEPGKEIKSGETRVFILDWKDNPFKNKAWYDKRKSKAEREGLLHIFAREVDRDTTAAVEGIVIKSEWVKAAIDAHKKLKINIEGETFGALDVADEGIDNHSLGIRKGILLLFCKEWFVGDVGQATGKALFHCKQKKTGVFLYDSIGVGAGVKSEVNRLKRRDIIDNKMKIVPWAASGKVLYPEARVIKNDKESPKNKDFFANLKAQAWWKAARRFENTFKAVEQGQSFDVDELISLDSKGVEDIHKVVKELSQATYSINGAGKMVINKQPKGTKSPNKADSIIMAFWPIMPRKVLI
jgi:hypothetical protein